MISSSFKARSFTQILDSWFTCNEAKIPLLRNYDFTDDYKIIVPTGRLMAIAKKTGKKTNRGLAICELATERPINSMY